MLRVSAGCLLLALLVWLGAFHVDRLHDLDARLLSWLHQSRGTRAAYVVDLFSSVIAPWTYLLLCLAVVGVGARVAGLRAALAAAVAIAGANLTTQLLKPALADVRYSPYSEYQIDPASWPSGHATATTVLVLAALMVAPARLRAWVALLGGAWAAVVVVGVAVNHWHYPSDALGGVLVAGAWASTAAAWVSSRRLAPAATAAPRRRWLRATG